MHFLITAGGTREYIDPVRFISNASSGRMGYALAIAALKAGHDVTLITAPTALKPPDRTTVVEVESAAQMFAAVKEHFKRCNCLIMAAAVSDYTPARPAKNKIKKSTQPLTIKLKPTKDILKWAGQYKHKGQLVVGFALEDKALRPQAEKKLKSKNLDLIVANEISAIAATSTTVQLKSPQSPWTTLQGTKPTLARIIITAIQTLRP